MSGKSHLRRFRRRYLVALLVLSSVAFGSVSIFGGYGDYLESVKTLIIQPQSSNQEPTAAIINKHIASLNKNASAHITLATKEEYIRMAMLANYSIVILISLFITFKTRTNVFSEESDI